MSSGCLEGAGNDRDRCVRHGGTFSTGLKCSNNPDPFVQAERQAQEAFKREAQRLTVALRGFPGWLFWGHTDEGWAAREDTDSEKARVITSPTPHGLIERVRRATSSAHRAPQQGSLL